MRRRWQCGRLLASSLLISVAAAGALARTAPTPPPVGYRPPVDTPEGGLWAVMDNLEAQMRVSPALIKDEALNAYVKKVLCDVAEEQCASLRLYIVEEPSSNAFSGPNGIIVIWSGLLLRVQSEAELAFILAHEVTHYLKRHSVANFERTTNSAGRVRLLSAVTLGIAALPAALIASGALASYSREQEREADDGGFDLVVAKGYDPRKGSTFMAHTAEERDAQANRSRNLPYLNSHPNPEQRLAAINERAAQLPASHANMVRDDSYLAAISDHRSAWLEQEFNRGDFEQSVTVITQLLASEPNSGELQYYLGEAYRRRNAKGDVESATEAYQKAIAAGTAPSAVYRGLGLVALKAGEKIVARDSLEKYLALTPEASDRAMVQFYLTGLGDTP